MTEQIDEKTAREIGKIYMFSDFGTSWVDSVLDGIDPKAEDGGIYKTQTFSWKMCRPLAEAEIGK